MEFYFSTLLVLIAPLVLFQIRNQLIFSIRMKAINIIYKHNLRLIKETGKCDHNSYNMLGSYDRMIFDLTKWTGKQFYPWWEKP
jgi:hypothetical protein